jgi:creatinine amidohydrolase/Fe(II)-dependent formamide hydrolase-like protein
VFSWIHVVSEIDQFCALPEGTARISLGHAGKGETQLIMAWRPELLHLEKLKELEYPMPEWLMDAELADPAEGRRWIGLCAKGWAKELRGGK